MLDQLPELYFAILKGAQIELQPGAGIRCSFELPALGKRTKVAPTARDAIRAVLIELTELLTKTPTHEWPESWQCLISSASAANSNEEGRSERFQAKARQFTIGVTMPAKLKKSLQDLASQHDASFAEVARQIVSAGFEDFDERSFSESSVDLFRAFSSETARWQSAESAQVMVRLQAQLAVRLRAAAKEHRKSASEFGVMCLAHGFFLQTLLEEVEKKVTALRGNRLRALAPKVGLGSYVALLSGILVGSIAAPKKILKPLADVIEAPEFALKAFFRRSFENSTVPAFKAEKGKPQVASAPRSWEEAVRSLNLASEEVTKLLLLDK
jgi:hypothetical protein